MPISASEYSHTYIESHANIPVGKHECVLDDTWKTADVYAFTTDHKKLVIPVVDSYIKYECTYEGTEAALVIRNTLHINSTKTKLINNLMMGEAGIQVNNTPNI